MGWQPIDICTPPAWHQFFGRQIGRTSIGMAMAFSPTALFFGIEVIVGESKGVGFSVGPLWIGFAALTPAKDKQ